MNASKTEPSSARRDSALPPSAQLHLDTHVALSGVLSAMNTNVAGGETLTPPLQTADRILRRAAAQPAPIKVPEGLAERTVAKCLTMALDGSMAGEVVV